MTCVVRMTICVSCVSTQTMSFSVCVCVQNPLRIPSELSLRYTIGNHRLETQSHLRTTLQRWWWWSTRIILVWCRLCRAEKWCAQGWNTRMQTCGKGVWDAWTSCVRDVFTCTWNISRRTRLRQRGRTEIQSWNLGRTVSQDDIVWWGVSTQVTECLLGMVYRNRQSAGFWYLRGWALDYRRNAGLRPMQAFDAEGRSRQEKRVRAWKKFIWTRKIVLEQWTVNASTRSRLEPKVKEMITRSNPVSGHDVAGMADIFSCEGLSTARCEQSVDWCGRAMQADQAQMEECIGRHWERAVYYAAAPHQSKGGR